MVIDYAKKKKKKLGDYQVKHAMPRIMMERYYSRLHIKLLRVSTNCHG